MVGSGDNSNSVGQVDDHLLHQTMLKAAIGIIKHQVECLSIRTVVSYKLVHRWTAEVVQRLMLQETMDAVLACSC